MKPINEAASQEAYLLHRMTNCGQDAAQNFIDSNPNVDVKKLLRDLTQDKAYRYIVRDIVSGVANPVYKKQFAKKYGELVENLTELESNATLQELVSEPLEGLRVKLLEMIRIASDPKWISALTSIKDDIVKLETKVTDAHKKLGTIPLPESSHEVTELVENAVTQTILEAFEPVKYDLNIHKTPETGAMDFELMPDNKTVEVTMPFKEEPDVQVAVLVNKSLFDDMMEDGYVESQEDLDNLDYNMAYRHVHDLFKRPDMFKKYVVVNTNESTINELALTSASVKQFLMFIKRYPKYLEELGFRSFKTMLDMIQHSDVNIIHDFIQELKPIFDKETDPKIKNDIAAISESLNLK